MVPQLMYAQTVSHCNFSILTLSFYYYNPIFSLLVIPVRELDVNIIAFDPLKSSDEVINSYLDLMDSIFIETYPDEDPSYMRKQKEQNMRNKNEFFDNYQWVALKKDDAKIIGSILFMLPKKSNPSYEENKHAPWFHLFVDKEYRRKGLGTNLLKQMIMKMDEFNFIKILQTYSFHQSGWEFCKKFGGKITLEGAQNRVNLSDINWDMLGSWKKQGENFAKSNEITLDVFEKVPDNILSEFTIFYTNIIALLPHENLVERIVETPESRRKKEKHMSQENTRNITMITRERNGTISGLTEITYSEAIPYIVEQELTGVNPNYRGRGLGKWLKTAMIFWIRENLPEVKIINTGNADVNAPMLSINNRIGFKRFLAEKCFSFEFKELQKSLK